jgi:hypothetical protein
MFPPDRRNVPHTARPGEGRTPTIIAREFRVRRVRHHVRRVRWVRCDSAVASSLASTILHRCAWRDGTWRDGTWRTLAHTRRTLAHLFI